MDAAASMEEKYKSILNPTKNPEESFNVNLAEQLENYLQTYVKGEIPTNFNSAALLIQGCSHIYSKKVEYLYNLASNLHETLTKHNRKDDNKKKDPKERAHKQNKIFDPFCSTEIKIGKHLSCLRKKNAVKANVTKKSSKKTAEKKHAFVPVDLLPLESEEKGGVFYDTRGEAIGNKNDYTLNKCRITQSGWLLLPTVSPENIPEGEDLSSLPGCSRDSPADEGYPASSGCPSSIAPSSQALSSQQTDEGLGSMGSTPSEAGLSQPSEGGPSQPEGFLMENPMDEDDDGAPDVDMENIPLEDYPTDEELAATPNPQRRSMRKVLQQVQLQQAKRERDKAPKEDLFAVRRPIEKNNTVCYPPGMRSKKPKIPTTYPASVYCARTFFSVDTKLQKKDIFSLQVRAFANNSKFLNKIKSYKESIKAAKTRRKSCEKIASTVEEEEEVEIEDVQEATDEDHSFAADPGPLDDDFDTDDEQLGAVGGQERPPANAMPSGAAEAGDMEAGPSFEFDEDEMDRNVEEQMALFRDDLQTVEQTAEMTQRVREWEKVLKPFLAEISKREKFDINLYGSHILNAFEESNRRQTMLFREFCEGKEKYEIHRYFLALLPLANVGNVHVTNEANEEGEEDAEIAITLLSRRMHHMELEEFGHNEGQH